MNIKIVEEYPPNIDKIRAVLTPTDTAIYAYNDTIYNPHNQKLDIPVVAHEIVHLQQQLGEPEKWWDKYLSDPQFRLTQEVEAYQVQYRRTKQDIGKMKGYRDKLAHQLQKLAITLSSPMYGSLVSLAKAKQLIKYGS